MRCRQDITVSTKHTYEIGKSCKSRNESIAVADLRYQPTSINGNAKIQIV